MGVLHITAGIRFSSYKISLPTIFHRVVSYSKSTNVSKHNTVLELYYLFTGIYTYIYKNGLENGKIEDALFHKHD